MNKELDFLEEMFKELRMDNSRHWKEDVLRRYPEYQGILELVYNNQYVFNVTGKAVSEFVLDKDFELMPVPESVEYFLNILKDQLYSGHTLYIFCCSFITQHLEHTDLILSLIDRDINCGISKKTINSIYPRLIPEFNVPLAKTYKDGMCDFEKDTWYASRKMNGFRCITIIDNGIRFFSRVGKEIFTLDKIKKEIEKNYKGPDGIVLDGELCVLDENGLEHWSAIAEEFRRKDHTIKNPKYMLFDVYTIEQFNNSLITKTKYKSRLAFMVREFLDFNCIEILNQTIIISTEIFNDRTRTLPEEWEGLILRKEGSTYFKRHKSLLKVKKFLDGEFIVTNISVGRKTIDGLEQDCCGALCVEYKGSITRIGTGLSDKQRIQWYKEPHSIIGKSITVKYFSESIDKHGKYSLLNTSLVKVWDEVKE